MNNGSSPDPDAKAYDPSGHRSGCIISALFVISMLLFVYSIFSLQLGNGSETATWFFFLSIIFFGVLGAAVGSSHENKVEAVKRAERIGTLKAASEALAGTKKLDQRIKELEESMTEIAKSAIQTGDIIINGKNAAVVVGSGSIEVIVGTKKTNPELANALTAVLGHIENTRNEKAAEFFEKFMQQMNEEKPDKTILREFWDSLVAAAPTIKQMAEIVVTITKAFG